MSIVLKNLLLFFVASSVCITCFGQNDTIYNNQIKRTLEKLIVKKLDADYKTGSAFSILNFKADNGKLQVIDFRSSNTEFQKALERLLTNTTIEVPVNTTKEKNYLALIVYMAHDNNDHLLFNNNTYESMSNFGNLKFYDNPIVLPPIVIFTSSPIQ